MVAGCGLSIRGKEFLLICSQIVTPDHFPAQALAAKPNTKIRKDGSSTIAYPVQFLGSPEYYWSKATDIKPLTTDEAKSWLESGKKTNTRGLKSAYQQALEEPSLDQLMQSKIALQNSTAHANEAEEVEEEDNSEDQDMDEHDPELDDEGKPIKARKTKGGNKTPKKSSKTPTKRRKSDAPDAESSAKKKSKPNSARKASVKVIEHSTPSSPELTPEETKKRAWENKVKSVMYLRHKLQKTLLGKEEPKAVDLEEVPGHLDKLDNIEVDVDIFRETKIGKVLVRINKLGPIPGDEALGIKSHVTKLLSKWQEIMTEASNKGTGGMDGSEARANGSKTEDNTHSDVADGPNTNGDSKAAEELTASAPEA